MTRIIAATAIAFATLAGAANAMTTSNVAIHQIQTYAPGADLSGLSAAEIQSLLSIIRGGDNEGEKARQVQAFLQ